MRGRKTIYIGLFYLIQFYDNYWMHPNNLEHGSQKEVFAIFAIQSKFQNSIWAQRVNW